MPRASERRSAASQRHADTIRFVLFEARPAGLTFPQLVRSGELTPSQTRAGLACLRDIIAERGWPPLIWTKRDGYRFCTEAAELQAYELSIVREKLTDLAVVVTHRRHRSGRRPLLACFLRRFDIEHTFRLFKQTLGWTKPRLRSSEAADRWTWLVIAAYAQLRLARPLATDLRRPWEKPTEPNKLTPTRVRRVFRNLHAKTGSPAGAPKPSRPPQSRHQAPPRHLKLRPSEPSGSRRGWMAPW